MSDISLVGERPIVVLEEAEQPDPFEVAVSDLVAQLKKAMPKVGDNAEKYAPHILGAWKEFGLDHSEKQREFFIAELSVETGQLSRVSENLNYSADGLANTWPHRYGVSDGQGDYVRVTVKGKPRVKPNELAEKLAGKPEAIANNVYADRMGNGPEDSGDGYRFRGGGGFQITGGDMHRRGAKFFKMTVEEFAEWVRTPEGAMRSACWFWWQAGCAKPADLGDFDAVSDLINIGRRTAKYGDSIGFHERLAAMALAEPAIA